MSGPADITGVYGGKIQIGQLVTAADGTVSSSTGSMTWARSSQGVYKATFEEAFVATPIVVVDSPVRAKIAKTVAKTYVTLTVTDDVYMGISLNSFREVDSNSDVSNIAGNGGVLASDTSPIFLGDTNESQVISWAASKSDPIAVQVPLPPTFSGKEDVTVELWVSSGTTDAASFVVETGWDDAALVSDTASDTSTKSATRHKITATVAADDVADSARNLTLVLTPPVHTSDGIILSGVAVRCAGVMDLVSGTVSVFAASSYEDEAA